MAEDKSRGPKRSKAKFEEYHKKNRKLEDLRYDESPSRLLSKDAEGQESPADRELRRMQNNDMVRSRLAPAKNDPRNTNPRRYR